MRLFVPALPLSFLIPPLLSTGCILGKIEEPKYKIIEQVGEFEVREYEETLVAETLVEGDFDDAPSEGFRRLADYIFGNNLSDKKVAMTAPVGTTNQNPEEIAMTAPVAMKSQNSEKIAMTAPVAATPSSKDGNSKQQEITSPKPFKEQTKWVISFTMPSKYTLATIPMPVNPAVTLRTIPAYQAVAMKFSGFNNPDKVAAKIAAVNEFCQKRGYRKIGAPNYARYNPPWTLWFMRRNEVIQTVETKL
jgi:hypothetical protein